MTKAKYDYSHSRSNLSPAKAANDNEPAEYGYAAWESAQPANENEEVDLDDYEFIQSVASGETK